MSNVAFDQILQITAPTVSTSSSPAKGSSDREGFRAHLDRATDAADAKTKQVAQETDSQPVDDDDQLTVESGQQENATSENEETTDRAERDQTTSGESDEKTTSEDSNSEDEVTLSAAAAIKPPAVPVEQVAEPTVELQVTADAQQPVPGGRANNQVQSNQGQAQQATELLQPTSEESLVHSEQAEEAVAAKTAKTTDANLSEILETPLSSSQASQDSSGQIVAASAASEGLQTAKRSQTPANSPFSSQSVDIDQTQESSPPTSEHATSTPTPTNNQAPATLTTTEIASSIEAELTSANPQTSLETNTTTTPNTAASTGSELIAGVEKASNVLTTGKADGSSRGGSEQSTSETPTVDRAKFVQRVGGAIRSAQQRDGQIQLRLSPPELGTLKIQLTVNEGAITANLETENATARTVLLENLPVLRERLAEQGITIEKFDVDVGSEGQQQADNPADGERDSNRTPHRNDSTAEGNTPETSAATPDMASINSTSDAGLDVQI